MRVSVGCMSLYECYTLTLYVNGLVELICVTFMHTVMVLYNY